MKELGTILVVLAGTWFLLWYATTGEGSLKVVEVVFFGLFLAFVGALAWSERRA